MFFLNQSNIIYINKLYIVLFPNFFVGCKLKYICTVKKNLWIMFIFFSSITFLLVYDSKCNEYNCILVVEISKSKWTVKKPCDRENNDFKIHRHNVEVYYKSLYNYELFKYKIMCFDFSLIKIKSQKILQQTNISFVHNLLYLYKWQIVRIVQKSSVSRQEHWSPWPEGDGIFGHLPPVQPAELPGSGYSSYRYYQDRVIWATGTPVTTGIGNVDIK